jgi:hypothetical protein
MLAALFPGGKGGADDEARRFSARAVHEALGTGLSDMEAFAEHTAQITEELKRIQKQRQAEHEAAAREKQEVESAWLQRLRCGRLETALRMGVFANDMRLCGKLIRRWAEVVGNMRRETLAQRHAREETLQLRLRDSGRSALLAERQSLQKQATTSQLQAQQMRSALSERSQELERTVVRDTMAFELWASDALRMKPALEDVHRKSLDQAADHAAEVEKLRAEITDAKADGEARRHEAVTAVASAMGGDVARLESETRVRAANQAIVVRIAVEHSTLHRYWKTWAAVASLLLREAGGALLQLELSKQQQRGVHTRLQAELAAEVAVARVENIEARTLLTKAQVLDQLRPGHELATDKELLREQSRALQAAHESAAAAHMAAAAHRVGEESLTAEIREAEGLVSTIVSNATYGRSQKRREEEEQARAQSRSAYDRNAMDFIQQQEAQATEALKRAGCELRVLVRSLQTLESEGVGRVAPSGGFGAAATAAPPERAPPQKPAPAKSGGAAAKKPPRAQPRGRSPLGR